MISFTMGKYPNIKSVLPLLASLLFLGLVSGCTSQGERERPNILWIVSEDNSPLIGSYGYSLATTPNLDRLAERGVVYDNAFATTPVCAPSRFTIITGLYGNAMGTENMRSTYPIPDFARFFPKYLREAGYYTTNNSKKDYNTVDQPEAWDESSDSAHYSRRAPGQPFFHVKNIFTTHESRLHDPIDTLIHDPGRVPVPPYHPETEAVKRDWAHYYDLIMRMDEQVGEILDELEASGEAENTIVFYYSDHGGAMPRGKRFMFESGLRIPLIVYFPEKYDHLAPEAEVGRTGRLVSFVDFGPTVLSLAGIDPPEYMHGKPFLGGYSDAPRNYVHTYRARMDERFDLVRAVRDEEYLYVHNYMPQRIYGQHLSYLWQAPSMQSWHQSYLDGDLNEIQRRFFESKPAEELYDVSEDPHNINNLAADPDYRETLTRLRQANTDWMLEMQDLGFIPESTMESLRGDGALYDAVREQEVPIELIIETAEIASFGSGSEGDLELLAGRLGHDDPTVRFWAAMGMAAAKGEAKGYGQSVSELADDTSPAVRLAAAEALYGLGDRETAFGLILRALDHPEYTVQLRALNLLEALDPGELPVAIREKVAAMNEQADEQWGTDYYIRSASATLLD